MDVDYAAGARPDAGLPATTPSSGGGGITAICVVDGGAPGSDEARASLADGVARLLFQKPGGNAGEYDVLDPDAAAASWAWGNDGEAPDSVAAGATGGDGGRGPSAAAADGAWRDNGDAPFFPEAVGDAGGAGG